MDNELVLLARTAVGETTFSTAVRTASLAVISSGTASTTSPASAGIFDREVTVDRRRRTSAGEALSLPFSAAR